MAKDITTSARLGQTVGRRYLIRTQVGAGAFGVVFRANDLMNEGRVVAIKTLSSANASDLTVVKRIARETEIGMQLGHPNTARLFDHGVLPANDQDRYPTPYLVFELVRGLPLGELLAHRGKLTLDETVHVVASVLDSLEEAHSLGILHRDLKPNNILVACDPSAHVEPTNAGDQWERLGIPGPDDVAWFDVSEAQIKVVDFGLGRFLNSKSGMAGHLTAAGVIAGTPHFISPEQARGAKDLNHQADIYGAAMLLHSVLTGRPLHDGSSTLVVALKHINEDLPDLPEPWTGHPVNAIFRRAGAKEAEDRYVSAAAMAYALRALLDPQLAAGPTPDFSGHAGAPSKPRRRSKLLARLFGLTPKHPSEADET